MLGKLFLCGLAHRGYAGADATASRGDLLIRSAGNTLFKVYEAGCGKDRMSVCINEAGENNSFAAINLLQLALIFLEPWVTQDFALLACDDDFASAAKYSGILDESDFSQCSAAARSRVSAQGQELANVGQEEVGGIFNL